jgi:hypothetical protein
MVWAVTADTVPPREKRGLLDCRAVPIVTEP